MGCDCSDQLQGVPGPPGPKCQKTSQKGRPGPVGPECQKSAEKVTKKSPKSLSLALFRDFFDFFGTFLALRADRPGTTFLRLFWHFGPGGPGTPCNWSLQSQELGAHLRVIVKTNCAQPWYVRKSGKTPAQQVLCFGPVFVVKRKNQ